MAGMAVGLVMMPAVFFLFNTWNSGCSCYHRNPCYGGNPKKEFSDCDACAKAGNNDCGYQFNREIYRDDVFIGSFRPVDYMPSTIVLSIENLEGDDYSDSNNSVCPPTNWTLVSANSSGWHGPAHPNDLFITLTAVDEFGESSPQRKSPGQGTVNHAAVGQACSAVFLSAVVFLLVPGHRRR